MPHSALCSGLLSLNADTAALSRRSPSVAARDGSLRWFGRPSKLKSMGVVTCKRISEKKTKSTPVKRGGYWIVAIPTVRQSRRLNHVFNGSAGEDLGATTIAQEMLTGTAEFSLPRQ